MPAIRSLPGLVFGLLLAIGNSAFAQQFSGQVVTLLVNYPAGGPTDIEARIIAKYLPKYVDGVGSIIVRNIGGAGGRIGVNQLGESSAKDWLNISFFTWNPVDQIVGEPTLKVRFNDLKFITGFRTPTLLYMRRDTPPGITKPADVAKARLFRAGALAPTSHGTLRQRLALDLLGAKFETIAAYKGLGDVQVAVRQGDIHLTNISLPSWSASVKPQLVDTGIVLPVLQYGSLRPEGAAGRSPDLPDVPTFLEVYKEIRGKDAMPSGEKWQALQMLTHIMDSMYRTVFMPPNAPAPAVEEMRASFEKLGKDAEFVADYEKVVKTKPRFIPGAEGERIISELLGKVSPAFVSFLRTYIAATK
ncbi:MAG: hypothetical protein HYU75_13310 [Betaproteobacteria bacterium]|nr:hypothetical protein [Betaproteobacteria bacterium]